MLIEQIESQRPQVSNPSLTRTKPTGAQLLLPAGLVLVSLAWTLAWLGPEPLRWYTFVPLWLGYVLTVDGLTVRLTGASYLSTMPRVVVGMFVVSMPCWWLFEAMNERLDNWHYRLPVDYGWLGYGALATLAFSTVVPAVLLTAALYRSLGIGSRQRPSVDPPTLSRRRLSLLVAVGLMMLALVLIVPRQAFPLAWLSLVFIVDPFNALRGHPSLIAQVMRGDWSRVLSLSLAGLTCGVFWEMWNFWSMPKWEYDVPYVGFWPIFEMPILGYGGYIPFAWELYALWTLAGSLIPALAAPSRPFAGRFRSI